MEALSVLENTIFSIPRIFFFQIDLMKLDPFQIIARLWSPTIKNFSGHGQQRANHQECQGYRCNCNEDFMPTARLGATKHWKRGHLWSVTIYCRPRIAHVAEDKKEVWIIIYAGIQYPASYGQWRPRGSLIPDLIRDHNTDCCTRWRLVTVHTAHSLLVLCSAPSVSQSVFTITEKAPTSD